VKQKMKVTLRMTQWWCDQL